MSNKPFLINFATDDTEQNIGVRDFSVVDDFNPWVVKNKKISFDTKLTEVDGETTDDE